MTSRSQGLLPTIALLAFAISIAACDVDLFGNDRRSIVGPYGLFVGEGSYWVVLDGPSSNREVLGGTVRQIGWNEKVILFEQETCGGVCPLSGWLVVHVSGRTVEGPIDAVTIKARSDLADI